MGIVAKYKFDKSICDDLLPEFNEEFTSDKYNTTDEEVDGIITRTIESNELPTLMRFGRVWVEDETNTDNRTDSLLEVLNMNTSGLTDCLSMFRCCKSLTSISCEWNVSNVTNMQNMFYDCNNLTTLDVSNFDTSNVTNMNSMFNRCYKLTLLDVSNWNTSNVTNMYCMFYGCYNLTLLDVSNWNTNNVTNMRSMFNKCNKLTSLDVSNFDTSEVTDMAYMFQECINLTSLDLSNFDTSKVTNTYYIFNNTPLLTDIGMIYCDQSTINKVASVLPTDHNITIWVESDDILQYDQYDHITYKTQKVQDTVHLNSPLLKGDTIEVIDGKTYHVHRYEEIQYQDLQKYHDQTDLTQAGIRLFKLRHNARYESTNYNLENLISEKAITVKGSGECLELNRIYTTIDGNIWLSIEANTEITLEEAKQRIGKTIGKLVTPYYELISEKPLELTLLDTTDNTINNNSILPSNMTIANKELSTIAIKPSTTYTLSFDKSNVDSEVTIDICGGEQITTVLNRIELTTPSELGSGIRFISSDGCIISNVRLLEGSLVEKAIPKETFEGLQSSFDEGYIIGENLAVNTNKKTLVGSTGDRFYYTQTNIIKDTVYTVYCKLSNIINISEFKAVYSVNGSDVTVLLKSNISNDNNIVFKSFVAKGNSNILLYIDAHAGQLDVSDLLILEGDHTHLSKAELMRYIEKGTSHYEEEDYNHVGKYKVEYKVTGKNKFDMNTMTPVIRSYTELVSYDNGEWVLKQTGGYPGLYFNFDNIEYFKGRHWITKCDISTTNSNSSINCQLRGLLPDGSSYYAWSGTDYFIPENATTVQLSIIFHNRNEVLEDNIATISNIQIEEGTVATEYEPYKEDIKTYYLSSPLLEGDTIEDVNGVATHVKRYGKVVLDGSDDEKWSTNGNQFITSSSAPIVKNIHSIKYATKRIVSYSDLDKHSDYGINFTYYFRLNLKELDSLNTSLEQFLEYLSKNPIECVCELTSPIYEPISTESILCDSYVNGHLDVNSAVPIEKVMFKGWETNLNYLYTNTAYNLQFESDNIGELSFNLGSTLLNQKITKGVNHFNITTPDSIANSNMFFTGIGFNASNIQVVKANEDIEFGYFKGLKSTFESELVTDENDENYGKYKVECKIVGKNKCKEPIYGYVSNQGDIIAPTQQNNCRTDYIEIKPNTNYIASIQSTDSTTWASMQNYSWFDKNKKFIQRDVIKNAVIPPNNAKYLIVHILNTSNTYFDITKVLIQIEEGTQATEYEPYKESIHTLYLNSPLLKGDKLVVHDGKLCHYHKMGMVVLDGSENWNTNVNGAYWKSFGNGKVNGVLLTNTMNKKQLNWQGNLVVEPFNDLNTADSFKQWLSNNPTTVVYELAEPYYEPIEPQLSQYSFSTVKDGDMEIITVLPIEKVNLTYRTDINGVSSIEEQIASIQEGTDISSIIDEEVDE